MKWIALALIIFGLVLIGGPRRLDIRFDNGAFLVEIARCVGGSALVAIGFLWLIVLIVAGL
jgi:hypothetical protein